MQTIRLKSTGADVVTLQQLLKKWGYLVDETGIFEKQTEAALQEFQKSQHLGADGIAGPQTWAALQDEKAFMMSKLKLTEQDFQQAALKLNVKVAAIKAVQEVETGGRGGFFAVDHPAILFEGHIFWNQLKQFGINPNDHVKGNENILYPKWTREFYKGGLAEYDRLERAKKIHEEAAICSASWGMFQIMGFNYKVCGCKRISEFAESMHASEGQQLDLFVRFLKGNGWDKYLRNLDWAEFALHYNGAGYAQNRYDEKLKNAYSKY